MSDSALGAPTSGPISPTESVRSFLAQYRGAKVYYPLFVDDQGKYLGNNGDRLIMLGVAQLFSSFGLQQVEHGDDADLVLLCGGGAMMERGQWVRGLLRDCCHRYASIPLCVLPSTFHFPTHPIGLELGPRRAPVTLFCRELYSHRHLRQDHILSPWCSVDLDHDMAFELQNTDFLRRLRQEQPRHVLIIERVDQEHPRIAFDTSRFRWRRRAQRWLPGIAKRAMYPVLTALRASRRTPFREQCEKLLAENYPEFLELPRLVCDVSNTNAREFESFCQAVAGAAVVMTTRLHPGILGAMLGRPTHIFDGPYHKIRGVYEYSLAHLPYVHLEKTV